MDSELDAFKSNIDLRRHKKRRAYNTCKLMRLSIYPWWLFIRLPDISPRLREVLLGLWDVLVFYVLLGCFILALSFGLKSLWAHHPEAILYLRARNGPFVRGWFMPYIFAWYLWWLYQQRPRHVLALFGVELLLIVAGAFLLPWAPQAAEVVKVATWVAPWVILLVWLRRPRHRFFLITERI